MITVILKRAFAVLMKKPFVLWGISLLNGLLGVLTSVLFGVIPGVSLAITLLLNTAMTMIFLHGYRGEEVHSVQLFDCFRDGATLKRVLGGMAWSTLWNFLWGLIPIVGPIFFIIKSYAYRLTPYILMTEPDVKATDAFKVSEARTYGYKGKMFGADVLVVVLFFAAYLVLGLFSAIPVLGILFTLAGLVLSIGYAALSSLYFGLIQAAFYEEITAPSQAVICPKCGKPVPFGASFCASCGAPVQNKEQ